MQYLKTQIMAEGFSFNRVFQFVKRDLVMLRGTFTTGISVAIVLLFLFCLLNMVWDQKLDLGEFFGIFGLFYIPLGIIFTFSIFREFNNNKTNHLYLTIPISIPERLMAKWLTVTLLYTVVFSVIAVLVGTLAIVFGIIVFGADFNLLSLFSEHYWKVVKIYLVFQPVFMVGAISFSKNRIGKTILALGILFLGFVLFNFLLYAMLNSGAGVFSEEGLGSQAFDMAGANFSTFGKWFYGLIFGPLMLVVAYLKMTEKEV